MKAYHDKNKGIGIVYDNIYLINGARTPFGKLCGTLGNVSPTDLGIFATRAAIEKSGIKAEDIDQLFYANIGQSSADSYFYQDILVCIPVFRLEFRLLCCNVFADQVLKPSLPGQNKLRLEKQILACAAEQKT